MRPTEMCVLMLTETFLSTDGNFSPYIFTDEKVSFYRRECFVRPTETYPYTDENVSLYQRNVFVLPTDISIIYSDGNVSFYITTETVRSTDGNVSFYPRNHFTLPTETFHSSNIHISFY